MDAGHTLEGEVRELIRRSGLDPARDEAAVRSLVRDAVTDYDERSMHGGLPLLDDLDSMAKTLWDTVAGYGPLQQYFDDPRVEEIWVNEPSRVFVARDGVAELTTTLLTRDQVRDLVERMLKSSGRRVDLSSPFVDAVLPDGSRLHVVIPDISREHWFLNIRKFVVKADSLDDLVRLGTLTAQAARFLEAAVVSGLNILVAGGTQAGKTTLLNCLAAAVPARERLVTCEEVFELRIPHRDVAAMQCRQSSLEGTGEIPLRRLVKEALRMRPSRIIVGEVRQAESLDLLIALNSGLPDIVNRQFTVTYCLDEPARRDLLPHIRGPHGRWPWCRASARGLRAPSRASRRSGCGDVHRQRRIRVLRAHEGRLCRAARCNAGRRRRCRALVA